MVIFSGVKGFLDKIEISRITEFEKFLLQKIRVEGKEILGSINKEKSLSEETEKKLTDFLNSIINDFLGN